MSFNLDRLTAESEEIWPTKDAPTSDVEEQNTFSHGAFILGAHAVLELSDITWKQEREAISRTVDPLAWRNVDHFLADGKDLRFCWPWIKTPLRRADDVLWLLGFTRAEETKP